MRRLSQQPRRPFPQHASYIAGTIRPSHRSQEEQDGDVRTFYDLWSSRYLVAAGISSAGHPLYRISFGETDPSRTVSEGQGYGMLALAIMAGHDVNARMRFDGLWRFSREHPSRIERRLMSFEVPENPPSVDSAFDGDADIACALLLADAQWGSGGEIDYQGEALDVIAAIKSAMIGEESRLPMLGDWVNPSGTKYSQYTPRSSDFMPAHFRIFSVATGDPLWLEVVAECHRVIDHLQANHAPATGLLPDFITNAKSAPEPAPKKFLEEKTDGEYSYNAVRFPWRVGTDAVLSGDPRSLGAIRKVTTWAVRASAGQPMRLHSGYKLNGKALPKSEFSSIFAATFAVAAMCEPSQQQWLNDLYTSVVTRHEDYFEDSVTLHALIVLTGNYWGLSR